MDIAVVGAGPAGARAAWVLASNGARVTLFDASHPREKPCGGGVTGRALALVADAIDPASFPRTTIRSARFIRQRNVGASVGQFSDRSSGTSTSPNGYESATVELDDDALVVASRMEFDAALVDAAQRAGAIIDRSRVTDVAIDAGGVSLETSGGRRRAAFVIGADGANSLVRRRLARPFRRDQLSVATGFFAHGVTSREIVIEFVADPPGYIWSFPRPGHLAIGVCADADAGISSAQLRARTAAWIRDTAIADGARLESYSWPIPALSARDAEALTLSGPRWLLVGDAAGLVDPITREGIYFALASGESAAASLLADAPTQYASRVADTAGAELARAARFKAGFFRPSFITMMVRALQQSPAIRAVMADLIAGRQSYSTLKWRLLKTFDAGAAWRLLTANYQLK